MTNPTDIVAPEVTASDSTIDAAREAFLSSFAEDDPGETAESEVVAPEAAPAVEASEAPAAEGVAPEAETPATESEARKYRKLLAGEARLREERKALEADLASVTEFKKLQSRAKADTVGYLRSLGLSQPEIMSALAEAQIADLGDLAPAEARVQLAARKAERMNAEMQEKLEAQSTAAAKAIEEREAHQFIQQYQAGITSFVSSELVAYPELSRVAAAGKPVAQAIYQTAVEMAQANPNGPPPSYRDVAAALNAQLAELASVVSAPSPTAQVPATPPVMAAQKPVLRNSSTQAQPSPAPEPEGLSYNELRERIRKQVLARYAVD